MSDPAAPPPVATDFGASEPSPNVLELVRYLRKTADEGAAPYHRRMEYAAHYNDQEAYTRAQAEMQLALYALHQQVHRIAAFYPDPRPIIDAFTEEPKP